MNVRPLDYHANEQCMIKKRYGVPALVLGLAVLGGSSAYAFGPGGFDLTAFSSFSTKEQSAIQKAHEIREAADTEAKAVLDAAGVTEEELHDAMKAYHEKQRGALDAALDSKDYAAFKALIADSPRAQELTEDVFAKLVEIRALEQDGDHKGAMELRKDLAGSGFMDAGAFGDHGPRGPRPDGFPAK